MILLGKTDRILLAENTLAVIALTDVMRQFVEPKHAEPVWPDGELATNVIPITRPLRPNPLGDSA